MDNYEISKVRAQRYFLGFDQERIIRGWELRHDESCLYAEFLGMPYAISRQSGEITRLQDGKPAGFSEVLSIFDLLCHEGRKVLSGKPAPVNSLKGKARAASVGTEFHSRQAAYFDRYPEQFRSACLSLGAEPVNMGDMGFRFPVFGGLSVILKFYRSDEDFPAALTLLWDENTLEFMYYETVFYVAGFLLETITAQMSLSR